MDVPIRTYKKKLGPPPQFFFVFFDDLFDDFRLGLLVQEHLPKVGFACYWVHLVVRFQLEERRLVFWVKRRPLATTDLRVHGHVVEVNETHLVHLTIFFHRHHLDLFHALAFEQLIEHTLHFRLSHKGHQMWDAKRWNRHCYL